MRYLTMIDQPFPDEIPLVSVFISADSFLGNASDSISRRSTLLSADGYSSEFRFYDDGKGRVFSPFAALLNAALLNNGDRWALLSLFLGLPLHCIKRIFLCRLGQISDPLSLLLTEIRENLVEVAAVWKLHQRGQQGYSAPDVPPLPSSPAPELVLSSR